MPANPKAKTKKGLGCLFIFWTLWTLLVGVFDLTIVYKTYQQFRTLAFRPVIAVLEKSSVETETDSEGTSYKPVVEYHYSINGKEFKSNQLEFLNTAFGPADARSRLPAAAIGNELTAYYDPESPEVAVLRQGFRLNDLIVPIFLLPFNAVSLCGLIYLLDWLVAKSRGYSALQFRIREFGSTTDLRFYKFSPLLASIMAAGACGFVMSFFIVFMPHGWISSGLRVMIAFFLILAASIWAYIKSLQYFTEISIDQSRGTLSFKKSGREGEPLALSQSVPLDDSISLGIKETVSTDSEGDTTYHHLLFLNLSSGDPIELYEYQYLEDAERMARWLSTYGIQFSET